MHKAMSTHRIARKRPCWSRWVLQVSQIVLETCRIRSCTGSRLVCRYCTRPKAAPSAQITRPTSRIAIPGTLAPRMVNSTLLRGGILMSASPPKAAGAAAASSRKLQSQVLYLRISQDGVLPKELNGCQLNSLADPKHPGLHQALHPLPARNEWGGPRRGETNKNAPPLPSPLLHPMEEGEKSRSLMQPWTPRAVGTLCFTFPAGQAK